MKRAEFIFTIGYTGNTAIVDGNALTKFGSLDTEGLLKEGLYKQALASAYYSGEAAQADQVLAAYNKAAGAAFEHPRQLERVFGLVPAVSEDVKARILK